MRPTIGHPLGELGDVDPVQVSARVRDPPAVRVRHLAPDPHPQTHPPHSRARNVLTCISTAGRGRAYCLGLRLVCPHMQVAARGPL